MCITMHLLLPPTRANARAMTLKVSLKLVIVIAVIRLPVWLCVLIVVPQDPKQWLEADEERRSPGLKGTM